jgi:hypothetical protein
MYPRPSLHRYVDESNERSEITGLCFGTRSLHPGLLQYTNPSLWSGVAQPQHHGAGETGKMVGLSSEAE